MLSRGEVVPGTFFHDIRADRIWIGDNLVFSGVTSELNAYMGLSAMGSKIVVRDSRFTDNGYIGLHGHQVSTLVVERSAVLGNNKSGFDAEHPASGIKVTESSGIWILESQNIQVFHNAANNPYVRNPGAGDYRAQNTLRLGAPVRSAMATELGVVDGTRLRIGPVSVTPRR